ncbi:MAG: hypothetical protein ACOY4R_17800 [Pseudomonadota bacterium]
MSTFLYRCPGTGATVSGWQAESPLAPSAADTGRQLLYVAERCPACGGLHIVNPATGRLLREESSAAVPRTRSSTAVPPLQA